jgi:hypothetical protein
VEIGRQKRQSRGEEGTVEKDDVGAFEKDEHGKEISS